MALEQRPSRDYRGYGRNPPRVIWPNNAVLAVNIQVNYEEGAEYDHASDGRNEGAGEFVGSLSDLPDRSVESAWEYGSRAGFWRVMRLLDEYGVKSTVNACAVAVERNRDVGDYLGETEHEVACHGYRFEEVWRLEQDEERKRIHAAVASLHRTCGRRPVGWISRLMPSSHTRELLVEEGGFLYDSDALNDDLPYFVAVGGRRHLVLPISFTYNDARFIMGGCDDPTAFSQYCCGGFDELLREGATHPKMMTVSLHPRIIGQAGRVAALRKFVEHALGAGQVWFARRADIAQWWLDHHKEFTT